MPCLDREWAYATSLSIGTPIWAASSFSLCQAPSLMVSKNFSLLTGNPQSLLVLNVYKWCRTFGSV